MYDKFYRLTREIHVFNRLSAQAQRCICDQAPERLLIQNPPALRQFQVHILTELIRTEPEFADRDIRSEDIGIDPGEGGFRLDRETIRAPSITSRLMPSSGGRL